MSNYEEWWSLASECFWIVSLADAAGERQIALAWYVVGAEWLSGLRPGWRPPVAGGVCADRAFDDVAAWSARMA